jgi:hypothetical protein
MSLQIQIDRTQIQAGEVISSHLEANIITAGKIAAGAIDASNLFAAGVVDSDALGADAVVAGKIAAGAIDASDLFAAGVVDNAALGADAVDGSKIADDAVDSEHVTDGAIDGAHLSTDAKTTVLGSKKVIQLVTSTDFSNPDAATVVISGFPYTTEFPFSTTAGVIGDGSVTGIPVLLELTAGNSGQSHGFNTNSNKVWGGNAGRYSAQVFGTDGSEIVDGDGKRVWAVITASARTTGGTCTIRFYSDEWPSAGGEVVLAAPYTMAQAYFLAYPVVTDLNAMAIDAFRGDTIKLSKSAAGLLGGSIGTAELEDGAVTEAKLDDGAVTTDKLGDNAVTEAKILDSSISSAKINDSAVTQGKIADGAITNAKVAADADIAESKLADLGKEGASDLLTNIARRHAEGLNIDAAYGAVIMASDTSAEGKVAALAAPDMAVRVQTGGVAYGPTGKRIVIPTSASLAIGAADGSNARYDCVVVNASGALAVRPGTANVAPSLPALTAGDVLLGVVKVAANVTDIQAADIFDHRRTANAKKQDYSWAASTATVYDLPRRAVGRVSPFRNGSRIVRASSPATADEFALTDPIESNGSRVTLGAAPSSCHVQIDYMG